MSTNDQSFNSHLHPVPSWQLADHEAPTGREEVWRFTPVKRFKALVAEGEATALPISVTAPEQVIVSTITAEAAREQSFDAPVDLVSARASIESEQATLVQIPRAAELSEPVTIEITGDGSLIRGHLLIEVGEAAAAKIILRHTGSGQIGTKVELHAQQASQVDLVSVQDWEAGTVHGGQVSIKVGKDAQVRTIQASIGQGDVRLVERAEYDGPGGDLNQLGLYFVRADQHVEHRLFVDHTDPHTVSHVDYRGALQGKGAHSVWIGDVLIRKTALDIETYETNRNLVLTEGCQADSVPNLEIETGEIRGAGHSSSTGRFDEEQLFYLRSRGIPEDQARRLIVEGFFLDIIGRIGVPSIEARLVEALNHQLETIEGVSHTSLLGDQA